LAVGEEASKTGVFINCPFDSDYQPIFNSLIFVIYACGFRPRSARELDDGGQTRIEKLYLIINECRFGVHDLSRTELDVINQLPRFNMPLELGIFLGAKRYGTRIQKQKRALVLDIEPYRYQRFISDLSGMDIHAHGGVPTRAIRETRDWLANVSRRQLPSAERLIAYYQRFEMELPQIAENLGFEARNVPYVDFERIVVEWLLQPLGRD
jgi:hypothetical protein